MCIQNLHLWSSLKLVEYSTLLTVTDTNIPSRRWTWLWWARAEWTSWWRWPTAMPWRWWRSPRWGAPTPHWWWWPIFSHQLGCQQNLQSNTKTKLPDGACEMKLHISFPVNLVTKRVHLTCIRPVMHYSEQKQIANEIIQILLKGQVKWCTEIFPCPDANIYHTKTSGWKLYPTVAKNFISSFGQKKMLAINTY